MTTTYLELTDVARIVRPSRRPKHWSIEEVSGCPAVNELLYRQIGTDFKWTDRIAWSEAEWAAHADRVETWWMTRPGVSSGDPSGHVAGFYELDVRDGSAEVAIFGLVREARGSGLGGVLLTHALWRGFQLAPRVWLHTCSDDGQHALANYRARGLRVYDVIQS